MKVTDAVRLATICRCSPNVGVEFVDLFARMRRRDCAGSVPPDLGLPMPGASGRTQPGHRCDGHLDARNEWFGRDRMLKRVAAQCGDRSLPRNRHVICRNCFEPARRVIPVLAIAASLTASYAETLECKPYRSRLSRDLDEPRHSFDIFSSVSWRPLLRQ